MTFTANVPSSSEISAPSMEAERFLLKLLIQRVYSAETFSDSLMRTSLLTLIQDHTKVISYTEVEARKIFAFLQGTTSKSVTRSLKPYFRKLISAKLQLKRSSS